MKNSKLVLCVILGIVFWFSGAVSVKFLGNYVFTESSPYKIIMLVLLFPISYIFVMIGKKAAKLEKSEILKAVVIMTIAATFCDGIALTWFRGIYAESYEVSHYGAAWILFGAGVGLLIAYFVNEAQTRIGD